MRTLPKVGLALVMLGVLVGTFMGIGAPASAAGSVAGQDTCAPPKPQELTKGQDAGQVSIVKVQGLVDPVMADFIDRSITDGERTHVVAVVLLVDSGGAVVSDGRLVDLARHIHRASVPVVAWIPPRAQALGGAAQLVGAAHRIGLSPGSRLGKTRDLVVPTSLLDADFRKAGDELRDGTVNDRKARSLQIAPCERTATIIEFLGGVDGFFTKSKDADGKTGGKQVRVPVTATVFSALPVQDQLFHTVGSPPAAYLLFVIGLSLIVFELYTAGVGVAGLVGAGCFVLSCYGLSVLPTRPLGIGLLCLAIFGFTIDVQTGVPRVWSGIGFVALVAGSFTLYDGLSLSWIPLVVGIVGITMFMIAGMPAMVRTRFSTPTIGREWMIGEEGEAVTNVSPDGVVRVRGALWKARTNRATPISLHDGIRVVEVDGLLLEVEPLEGGAVDYREKRRGGDAGPGDSDTADATDSGDEGVVLVDGRPL